MNIEINNNSFIGSLNGSQCLTKEEALRHFGNTFLFPKYYGQNLDALNDCLTDLEWIRKSKIILVINEFDLFLSQESSEIKDSFEELLNDVAKEWKNDHQKEFILMLIQN